MPKPLTAASTAFLAPLALLLAASSARADAVTYANYSAFAAATTGLQTSTIPDPAPSSALDLGSGDPSVTYDGVAYSSITPPATNAFFLVGPAYTGGAPELSEQGTTRILEDITITLPNAVTALAFNYGTSDGSPVTLTFDNGDVLTLGSTGSGYQVANFLGVTDGNAFSTVTISAVAEGLNLNGVTYGALAAVPEPSSLALCGLSGLIALGVARARRVAGR